MPALNSTDIQDLETLALIHGLSENPQWAIEGIALDLNLTTTETRELLISHRLLEDHP